jgi:hypothetical protein
MPCRYTETHSGTQKILTKSFAFSAVILPGECSVEQAAESSISVRDSQAF